MNIKRGEKMSVRIDRVKLIAEMAKRNMTVERLITKSELSRSTITAARSGKSCAPATAAKLAAGLGVKLEEILEGEV